MYQELDNIMDLRNYDAKGTEENPFVFTEQAQKYTWGVNFLNTEKTSTHKGINTMGVSMNSVVVDGTGVRNTAILRLKYEINGVVKNAYAIDVPTDDFTGSAAEVDITSVKDVFERLVSILMLLVLIVIIANVGAPLLGPVFNIIIKFVQFAFSFVIWIVTIPFKLIARAFRGGGG